MELSDIDKTTSYKKLSDQAAITIRKQKAPEQLRILSRHIAAAQGTTAS